MNFTIRLGTYFHWIFLKTICSWCPVIIQSGPKGRGKYSEMLSFRKVILKDSLVPERKKERRRRRSYTDYLSNLPILRFWERSGGQPWEDHIWIGKNHLSRLGVGDRKGVWKGEPYEMWPKQSKKSKSPDVLSLDSNSLPQATVVTSQWSGALGAISDCKWIV